MSSTPDVPENQKQGLEEENAPPPAQDGEEIPRGRHPEVGWNHEMAHPRAQREAGTMGRNPPPLYFPSQPLYAGYPPPHGYYMPPPYVHPAYYTPAPTYQGVNYAYPPPPYGYFAMSPPLDFRFGEEPPPGRHREVDSRNRNPYPPPRGGLPPHFRDEHNANSPHDPDYDHRGGDRYRRPDIDYLPNDPRYDLREGRFRRPDEPAPHFQYGFGNAPPPHAEPYGELVGPSFVQQGADGHRREGDWNNEVVHPPNTEPTDLRSKAMITAKKILKAWHGEEFKKNFKDIYKCELKDCVIDMKEWLDPLTSDNPKTVVCLIDLEPLRRQLAQGPTVISQNSSVFKERFLPRLIYVRQEMKGIFNLFCRDVNLLQQNNSHVGTETSRIVEPFDEKAILLGSPGVGKSILCFLAALYRSRSTVTIYIRQTYVSGKNVSVFIIFPEDDMRNSGNSKVRCLFSRRLKNLNAISGLRDLKSFLEENLFEREEYYLFLDGPRYNNSNEDTTLNGEFDYLCTSAGYPGLRNEERGNSRFWVMCGWTEEEAEAAFVQMHGDMDNVRRKARQAYALCGGKIRDMCSAFDDHEEMRESLLELVDDLKKDQVEFCLYSESKSEMNKIRIVFRKNRENYASSRVTQFIDSKFLWKVLHQKLGLERLVNDYKVADAIDIHAMAGWHFENTVHAWFSELVAGNQDGAIIKTMSDIAAIPDKNCDVLIPDRNQYWVPTSRCFRNIDSAVVVDHTLYAFQATVKKNHTFCAATFLYDFLDTMKEFKITSVQVCVITTQEDFAINPYLALVKETMHFRSTAPDLQHFGGVPRDGWLQLVDIGNVESFRKSMNGVIIAIRDREDLKRSTSTAAIPEGSNTVTAESPEGHVQS
jgi:hypothetical protein